jgi:predicted Zn finger-like uncharacterized protein
LNTVCPRCATAYRVDQDDLLGANCLAHCYRCGALFSVVGDHAAEIDTNDIALIASACRLGPREEIRRPDGGSARTAAAPAVTAPPATPPPAAPTPAPEPAPTGLQRPDSEAPVPERQLPFEIPDDLEPLEAVPDAALNIEDTLYEPPRRRRPLLALLTVVLALALAAQLAWIYRAPLLERFPQIEPLCEHLPCRPSLVHAPERMRVLQREIAPARNQPGWLTLNATVRNEAEYPQALPDVQLSLLDNLGRPLLRRRLAPADYLFPPPRPEQTIAPGEVFTLSVDFRDPGHEASGFMLDFY